MQNPRKLMDINVELIEARIREINDAIQILKDLIAKEFDKLTLHEKLSMRYLVIELVEAASSICVHILVNLYNERPEGYPDCFMRLSVKGIISEDLAKKLASAARLRNLLVHRYWFVDDEKVYESVKKGLKDFEEFIICMRSFLRSRK